MSLQLISLKCPECGATLNIEDGHKQIYCSYCGAKIYINNENEYTIHTIDEADIKRAETDRMVKMRQLDNEEHERRISADDKNRRFQKLIGGICFGFGIILIILATIATMADLRVDTDLYYQIGLLLTFGGIVCVIHAYRHTRH